MIQPPAQATIAEYSQQKDKISHASLITIGIIIYSILSPAQA